MSVMKFCLGILVVLIAICGSMIYLHLPNLKADLHLKYGSGEAKIYFEENGYAHIHADNRLIGSFAVGYLHAAERLWQMDYMRRLAQGTLSEVIGNTTIPVDTTMRLLAIRKTCEKTVTQFQSKEIEDYYEFYAKGINEYAENNKLPLQYYVFWSKFTPWTMVDTCSVVKLIHFFLNHDWGLEVARDYIFALTKDEELMNSMLPFREEYFDDFTTYIVNDYELQLQGLFHNKTEKEYKIKQRPSNITSYVIQELEETVEILQEAREIGGSNSWVLSGKHTKSGKPILVSDPHLSNTMPSNWYLVHIEYPDGSYITGASIPAVPALPIFTSDSIAIGMTAVFADNSDVYEERIQDGKYLYKDTYYDLVQEEEIVKVKGREDYIYNINKTRHGPLITDAYYVFGHFITNTFPIKAQMEISMRWTGMDPDNYTSLNDIYYSNYAKSGQEILDMCRGSVGIAFNVNFADTAGNIGFSPIGSFVKRDNEHYGTTISRGWTGENEWIGYVEAEHKPYLYNPDKGFIVAANNVVSSPNVKHPISVFTPSTARARRITELLQGLIKTKDKQIEYKDMIDILDDTVDLYTQHKKKNLISIVFQHFKVHQNRNTMEVQKQLHWLNDWEDDYKEDLEQPTYFAFWEYYIVKNLMVKQIEDDRVRMELLSHFHTDKFLMRLFSKVLENPEYKSEICSHYNGIEINSCPELITKAFLQAASHLRVEKLSHPINWGHYHQNHYASLPLTMSPLAVIFDRYVPSGGNSNTVKMTQYKNFQFTGDMFKGIVSANLKVVFELGGEMHYCIDSGQSENIFSSHYFDMNERCLSNELYTFKRSRDQQPWSITIRGNETQKDVKQDL